MILSDKKIRGIAIQCTVLAGVGLVVALLVVNTIANLRARGLPIGFDFLEMSSRLVISESVLAYDPADSYTHAIVVGIANTLFLSASVIVLSSVLGLLVGLARLSSNPLAAAAGRAWVELARNFPPVVLLIFMYALWWKVFPPVGEAIHPLPGVFLSMRGLELPSITWSADYGLAIGLPHFTGSNFEGGWELTPELSTILVGLTVYTTGYVAEIVRSGVLSVPKGQWEAARSLGLHRSLILRLVVVPQMLRVIVPPMNSQFINVVKNSTLAIAVGYPDFLAVMNTTISKSSHAIEGVFIILAVYLAINLMLSLLANWYNRRIGIVER